MAQLLGRSLRSELGRAIYGTDGQFEGSEVSFVLHGEVGKAERDQAIRLVSQSLRPAGPELAAKELGRLALLTKSRAEGDDDTKARLVVMADELANYPADVVLDALRYWARTEKFFPAWAELRDLLDRRVQRRKRLRAALQDFEH